MNKLLSLACIILLTCILSSELVGQDKIDKPNYAATTGLALEFILLKRGPPIRLAVSEPNSEAKGGWFERFDRIAKWTMPEGARPVKAVSIKSRLEGEAVKITILVVTGEKFFEEVKSVAEYSVSEHEQIIVKELADYGVEPIKITVIRPNALIVELPSIVNKTKSLEIIGIEPNYSTLPTFNLRVKNVSNKNIVSFNFETIVNNKIAQSGTGQNSSSPLLIAPGAIHEKIIPSVIAIGGETVDNKTVSKLKETIVISSLIFEDGNYEGDALPAAKMRAWALCRKLQFQRTIDLLQKASVQKLDAQLLQKLDQQISNLNGELDESAFNNLIKEFQNLTEKEKSGLRASTEIFMHRAKQVILKNLQDFTASGEQILTPEAIQNWLNLMIKSYQN